MKKLLAVLLAVCMVAFFASCTNTPAESTPADESVPVESTIINESTLTDESEQNPVSEPAADESSEEPAPAESSEDEPAEPSEDEPAESSEEVIDGEVIDVLELCVPEEVVLTDTTNGTITTCEKDADGNLLIAAEIEWPSATFYFDPIDVDVNSARLVFKAEIGGAGGASIRFVVGDQKIALHQFADVALNGVGDIPAGSVINMSIPFSELAFFEWAAETPYGPYAGRIPFDSDTVTVSGFDVCSSGGAIITVSELKIIG